MANNDSYTPVFPVDTDALLDRAQRYCAPAERCAWDVCQLLSKLGATDEQIDDISDKLRQQKYIDDARYCRAFVHDKVAFQGWGRMKIIMGLRAKRLPDSLINEAVSDIDERAYAANIRKLLNSKRKLDRQKQLRFMLQRGFTFEDLRTYANLEENDTAYENYD